MLTPRTMPEQKWKKCLSRLPQWNMQRNFHVGNQQFLACNIFQHQQLQQYGGVSKLLPEPPTHTHQTHRHPQARYKLAQMHLLQLLSPAPVRGIRLGKEPEQPSANTTRKIVSEANKILFSNARRHTHRDTHTYTHCWQVKWLKTARVENRNAKEIKKNCLVPLKVEAEAETDFSLFSFAWLLSTFRGLLGLNLNPS